MPDIYNTCENGKITNLTIVSNNAYYSYTNESKDLQEKLEGTVFFWEVKGE